MHLCGALSHLISGVQCDRLIADPMVLHPSPLDELHILTCPEEFGGDLVRSAEILLCESLTAHGFQVDQRIVISLDLIV
jgi:hypothetical protein